MKQNKQTGEQLPEVGAPQQLSLIERINQVSEQAKGDAERLSEEECEALRALVKKTRITKVCLAVKLGIKVNTLAYKLKNGTLTKEEAETILNEVIADLKG